MISPQASLASPRELPDSKPRVTLTSGGVLAEWTASPPVISEGLEGFSHIEIPGYELLNLPGVPRLPYSSVLVALPPDSDPVLEILVSSESKLPLQAPLVLGSQPAGVEVDSSGQVIGGAFTASNEEISGVDQVVTLEPIGILRGVHLARLSFFPVVPSGDNLRFTSTLKVEVNFGPVLQSSKFSKMTPDPILDLVQSAVINPEQLQITIQDQSSITPEPTLQLANAATVAVEVSKRGITDINRSELDAAGFLDSPINLSNLSLTRNGSNIAYDVVGNGNDQFEAGEKIRFFADPRFSRWTSSDTYFLHLNTPGDLMLSRSTNPSGVPTGTPWAEAVFEDNKIYTPACYCAPIPAGRDGDRWVWDHLLYIKPLPGENPVPVSKDYKFILSGIDISQESTLTVWLIGQTELVLSPDHQIDITINGNFLGTRQWDGKNSYETDFTFSTSLLYEGENTLTITLPGKDGIPLDGVWLDAFSIHYPLASTISAGESIAFSGSDPKLAYAASVALPSGASLLAYDISDPDQPEKLTGAQTTGNQITVADPDDGQTHNYWVTTTSAIQSPDNLRLLSQSSFAPGFQGADYVIISPAEFIPSLDPLVGMHRSNGLEVIVEDVQAIYDVYGGGRLLPSAIKDYLENAYFNWNLRPLYVLLVGDGTHDPKKYRATSSTTFIPPFLEDVDPWAGETAADNRYVTVDGGDALPDMLIGRLPANLWPELENPFIELDTMVSKIVQYDAQQSPSPWQHQAVFVADNNDPTSGDFPSLSDILINKFPTYPFAPQRLYFSPAQITPAGFRMLVKQVWDDGNGLIMFTGHSSIHQWAHEILFHLEDVPTLVNGLRLPVVLEMTCFTGSFQIPDFPTLDEALLRRSGGGAIAVWGSTGLGIATGHHWLAEGFMDTIYQDGISEIGAATLAGKLNLASVGSNPDLIDTFTLLGDPATKLERSYLIYLPINQN